MEAFYDLAQSPPTHDFVNWLSRAEEARILAGEASMQIRVVPGVRKFSWRDAVYSSEKRLWRIHNLLIPMAWLVPSVTEASLGIGNQTMHYVNPGKARPPIFKAPKLALEIISASIPDNAVTISLRKSEFEPSRNSNFHEWMQVADWLKEAGYNPVFIPDAEADMAGLSDKINRNFMVCHGAAYNHALRLALYELAEMNLMINSGIMVFALHSNVSMMAFKLFVDGILCCSRDNMRQGGFSPEHDWGEGKHLFWEEDTAWNVIAMLGRHLKPKVEQAAA